MVALAVVAVLALGVLAAALVKLAGSSSSSPAHTPTAPPASVTSPGTAALPSASASTPAATQPPSSAAATAPVSLGRVEIVSSSIVTLYGAVNPQGVPTSFEFQYGSTRTSGGGALGNPKAIGAGTAPVGVFDRIANLTPGTTYHYRLKALKAGRVISSADATFTMPSGR
jgi:hypothetical protein